MAEQAPAPCPRCGDAAGTQPLRAVFAGMRERRDEAGEAASRRHVKPAPPRHPPTAGEGGGTGPYPAEWIVFDAAAAAVGEVWRRTVSKPFKERVAPEISRHQDAGMQRFFAALDRHPELWCCQRDQVVFLAGGRRTVPLDDAGRMLIRGDDVALMALLEKS
jgi:hypothetical protein